MRIKYVWTPILFFIGLQFGFGSVVESKFIPTEILKEHKRKEKVNKPFTVSASTFSRRITKADTIVRIEKEQEVVEKVNINLIEFESPKILSLLNNQYDMGQFDLNSLIGGSQLVQSFNVWLLDGAESVSNEMIQRCKSKKIHVNRALLKKELLELANSTILQVLKKQNEMISGFDEMTVNEIGQICAKLGMRQSLSYKQEILVTHKIFVPLCSMMGEAVQGMSLKNPKYKLVNMVRNACGTMNKVEEAALQYFELLHRDFCARNGSWIFVYLEADAITDCLGSSPEEILEKLNSPKRTRCYDETFIRTAFTGETLDDFCGALSTFHSCNSHLFLDSCQHRRAGQVLLDTFHKTRTWMKTTCGADGTFSCSLFFNIVIAFIYLCPVL